MAKDDRLVWGGAFSPHFTKGLVLEGTHETVGIDIVSSKEEYGIVYLAVRFIHDCDWHNDGNITHPPSDEKIYVYQYEVPEPNEPVRGSNPDRQKQLNDKFNDMNPKERLDWFNDNKGKLEGLSDLELDLFPDRVSELFGISDGTVRSLFSGVDRGSQTVL